MNDRPRVLVTCPPMLGMIDALKNRFEHHGLALTAAKVVQTLSEEELCRVLPRHDGWIIGDDPATRNVFEAGKAGLLRAAVKWGIGVDNVDFDACRELGIPITNTPDMFGAEVADLALGYVIALARETFSIHNGVLNGAWPKPQGISLAGKTVALVGLGDIGKHLALRLKACEMRVIGYDPYAPDAPELTGVERAAWPDRLNEVDFVVVTCALTDSSHHMVNAESLTAMPPGVRIVNVGRGPVIHESALEDALDAGHVHSAALDVFEVEPLPAASRLRGHARCVFGSHNASNTREGVIRTSEKAINTLANFLKASA